MRIRGMAAADVDGVVALAAGLPTAPHWSREAYLAALDSDAGSRRVALVAELDGGIAGFVVASLIAPQAELESIAVAEASQRRGIAGRLFAALAEELAAAGATEILLEVRASNAAALGLYRRLGFAQTGRRVGYYSGPVEDALLLVRGL